MRRPTPAHARTILFAALLVALAAAGVLLVSDRQGLRGEYFALDAPWQGKRYYITVSEPHLETTSAINRYLATDVLFSARWSGWWHVEQEGRHGFTVAADDGAYVRVDGELLVDSRGMFGEPRPIGVKDLAAGFHALEIGFYQTHGEARLTVGWTPPGMVEPAELETAELFSGHPVTARRILRRALASWSRPFRQLLGLAVLITALLGLGRLSAPLWPAIDRLRRGVRPVAESFGFGLLTVALFGAVFAAGLRYAGSVRGGDDTNYLIAATFDEKHWFFGRYAHVYLLKFFGFLVGDPIQGVRVWWSFVAAVTMVAMAVAVRSLGPRLQLGTLIVALFVLFSQGALVGLAGAGFADYSSMMFVTIGIAVYLRGMVAPKDQPAPRHEWHALAIGALTLAAFRSKETGAVLVVLPALFALVDGRLDLRRFVRRAVYWAVGAVAAQLALMGLDAWILGDFYWSFDRDRIEYARSLNVPGAVRPRSGDGWFQVIWSRQGLAASLSMRYLWLGVLCAALAASLRRARLELRLLHLEPIAYLLGLIVLYVWMPHPFSTRMLIPILPLACLMTALLAHYVGLDEVTWRELAAPPVLALTLPIVAVFAFFVIPYRLGDLPATAFVPIAIVSRLGWTPDQFAVGVLLPAGVLIATGLAALASGSVRGRAATLLVVYLAFFGLAAASNWTTLARRIAAQQGDLLTYPWRVFRQELEEARPQSVAISPDLTDRFRMSAATRTALASLVLARRDLRVKQSADIPNDVDVAIVSRFVFREWQRRDRSLAERAVYEPQGLLVLVRRSPPSEEN